VAATHQDLEEAMARGRFREDLFYRLNVIPIEVPPLRERREDIPLLVHHFLDVVNQEKGKQIEGLRPDAMELLVDWHWPGNVRELENVMERMVLLKGEGELGIEDLPEAVRDHRDAPRARAPRIPSSGIAYNELVGDFETDLILQALEQTGWNKNRAAQLLGLNRTTLLEKIKKKNLEPQDE
jgi:DNA-binding NtrC family response regulator